MSEITVDPSDRPQKLRRLIAAEEIAETERSWSAARAFEDRLPGQEDLSPQERIARFAVHYAFYELVERQGTLPEDAAAVLGLFAATPELSNATLSRIDMRGEWGAADVFERDLLGMMFDTNYRQSIHFIDRESDEAKRAITIPAGFTKENGYVALRRKRRLIMASHIDGKRAKRRHIEVDKISTFALDIEKLSQLDSDAVAEVRLIVASTMYQAVDWETLRRLSEQVDESDPASMFDYLLDAGHDIVAGSPSIKTALNDFFRLTAAMQRYNMTLDQIHQRAYETPEPMRLQVPQSIAFVEQALSERSELLTPAATTYYVHA